MNLTQKEVLLGLLACAEGNCQECPLCERAALPAVCRGELMRAAFRELRVMKTCLPELGKAPRWRPAGDPPPFVPELRLKYKDMDGSSWDVQQSAPVLVLHDTTIEPEEPGSVTVAVFTKDEPDGTEGWVDPVTGEYLVAAYWCPLPPPPKRPEEEEAE